MIPSLNEAGNIGTVLRRLPVGLHEVVLVDGRSTDNTIAVARATYPDVNVVMESSPGKGAALAAGFRATTGDIIVFLDADGSTDPGELPSFVSTLLLGADVVKGSRYLHQGGSMTSRLSDLSVTVSCAAW